MVWFVIAVEEGPCEIEAKPLLSSVSEALLLLLPVSIPILFSSLEALGAPLENGLNFNNSSFPSLPLKGARVADVVITHCSLPLSKTCYRRSKEGIYSSWVASLYLKTHVSKVWLFSPRGFLSESSGFQPHPKLTIKPVVIEHVSQESLPHVTTPFRKVCHFGYRASLKPK